MVIPTKGTDFYAIKIWSKQSLKYESVIIDVNLFYKKNDLQHVFDVLNTSYREVFSIEVDNVPTIPLLDTYRVSLGVPNNVTTQAVILYNDYLTKGGNDKARKALKACKNITNMTVAIYDFSMGIQSRKYGEYITPMLPCRIASHPASLVEST
jgi:hypothetical protein